MNPLLVLGVVAGASIGVGVAVVLAVLFPGRTGLVDALAALDERTAGASPDQRRSLGQRLVLVAARIPGSSSPDDLDLLGMSHDTFVLARLRTAMTYAAAGPVLALLLVLLDLGGALVVPAGYTVFGFVVGWSASVRRVADRADRARTELRFALVSYLQQVSLLRSGGAGVATALSVPAKLLSDSWAMRRLADELEVAERSGLMPWEGIHRFGKRIGMTELADVSSIAATAGQDGGAVVSTLLARAEGLRDELLADELTAANRASGQMSTPGALQTVLIVAWLLYPLGTTLLTST